MYGVSRAHPDAPALAIVQRQLTTAQWRRRRASRRADIRRRRARPRHRHAVESGRRTCRPAGLTKEVSAMRTTRRPVDLAIQATRPSTKRGPVGAATGMAQLQYRLAALYTSPASETRRLVLLDRLSPVAERRFFPPLVDRCEEAARQLVARMQSRSTVPRRPSMDCRRRLVQALARGSAESPPVHRGTPASRPASTPPAWRRHPSTPACSHPPAPVAPTAPPGCAAQATRRAAASRGSASSTTGWAAGRRGRRSTRLASRTIDTSSDASTRVLVISIVIGRSSTECASIVSASSSAAPLAA